MVSLLFVLRSSMFCCIVFFLLLFLFYSFAAGAVFSVQNIMDDDWFWVVSQKDKKSGLVPKALTEAMVRSLLRLPT